MASTKAPSDTRAQAEKIREAWESLPDKTLNGITLEEFTALIIEYDEAIDERTQVEQSLQKNTGKQHRAIDQLWDIVKELLPFIADEYGKESTIYSAFGGTKPSEYHRMPPTPATDKVVASDAAPQQTEDDKSRS